MSVLSLFPSRVKAVNADGTLTPEFLRALGIVFDRVGGAASDLADATMVFAPFVSPSDAVFEMVAQPAEAQAGTFGDVIQPPVLPDLLPDVTQPVAEAVFLPDVVQPIETPGDFTGVTAGSYGDSSHVGAFTVNQVGKLTAASGVAISATAIGAVTAVSVASANGLAGTSSGGTTPALTLSTTVTGVLKGNGTTISAAAAGTDYAAPGQTFFLGTTSIAINRASAALALAGITSIDGSAAKWTTARNLAGNSVDGSANVAFANKFIVQGTADTGLSAAQFLGALGTGIVKNATSTGVLSIAVAGDFPTLNQNTTGSSATLTTPRSIYGNNFDGSAALSGIIASTFGGTGNGFTKFSGPATVEKTKTLRDATDTILELGGSYTPTGTWTSMALVTPALGTPASGTLTNCTGLPSTSVTMATTSFTATATGMTTSPTGTVVYTVIGNMVVMNIASISGTSNATTFTLTGMPAGIRPAATRSLIARVQDSGSGFLTGLAQVASSGTISLFKDMSGTAFTASGTKSIGELSFAYPIQ